MVSRTPNQLSASSSDDNTVSRTNNETLYSNTISNVVAPSPVTHQPDQSWGDRKRTITDNDNNILRLYSQNTNGIFDSKTSIDAAFNAIRDEGASIFCFQETHQDVLNPQSFKLCNQSRTEVWQNQGKMCTIAATSTQASVKDPPTVKPGGVMLGVTGDLSGRVKDRIEDELGRWCGVTLLGKDGRKILILTAYNVSQKIDLGIGPSTYYKQLQLQHQLQFCQLLTKDKKNADSTNRDKYINPRD